MPTTWRAIAAAAVLAAVLIAVRVRLEGPAPRPADSPSREFSAVRAAGVFRATIGGRAPHPVTSAPNTAVRERIADAFGRLGYQTRIDHEFVCDPYNFCATVENVFATRPEDDPRKPAVMLSAHYDSVPAGPGASDDGIGAASVLEIARALRSEPLRNRVVFLIDDGEEAGLLGAEGFAKSQLAGSGIAAVVNVEARGTSGPSFLFETSRNNNWFIPAVASSLPKPITSSLFAAVYDRMPNDTDLTVFKRAGLAGVNFAFAGDVVNYHTPNDDLARLDLTSAQHQGENALAAVRSLANADLGHRPDGDAVWFDVLGFVVVSWPSAWSVVMAIVSTASAAVAIFSTSMRRDALAGLASFLIGIVAAALVAYGVSHVVRGGETWAAYPQAALAAMWIIAVALPLAVASFLPKHDLVPGQALAWNLLAIATSVVAAGVSYLFIAPALALTLAVLVRTAGARADWIVPLAAAAVAALLWFPIADFLYPMLGAPSLPIIAVMVALVASVAVAIRVDIAKGVWTVAAIALIVSIAAARMLPDATSHHPRPLNVAYVDDGKETRWLVGELTPALQRAADFAAEPVTISPWSSSPAHYFAAAAPRLPLAPVSIQREATVIHVRSQRGATRIALMIHTTVAHLRINGVVPAPRPERFHDSLVHGWTRVVVNAPEAVVDIGTATPVEVVAIDTTFGPPAEARPLTRARDASSAIPIQDGDVVITMRREVI